MSKHDEYEYWVAVSRAEGIGPKTLRRIHAVNLSTGRTISELLRLPGPEIERDYGLNDRQIKSLLNSSGQVSAIRRELDNLLLRRVAVVTFLDESYPAEIRQALGEDAPAILYIAGDLSVMKAPRVAVVGSRHVAAKALDIAEKCASALAKEGVTIVSGYAAGVDAAAHLGALEARGSTIFVLPYGIANFALRRELRPLASKGRYLAISSYSPGQRWTAYAAMERNKLISALSQAVVVVSARESGGAINEAKTAFEQRRKVYAVEYATYDETNSGNHALLQAGAEPIRWNRLESGPNVQNLLAFLRSHEQPVLLHGVGSGAKALPGDQPENRRVSDSRVPDQPTMAGPIETLGSSRQVGKEADRKLADEVLEYLEPRYFVDYALFTGNLRYYVALSLEDEFKQSPIDSHRRLFLLNLVKEQYACYEDLGALLLGILKWREGKEAFPLRVLIGYREGEAVISKVLEEHKIFTADDLYEKLNLKEWIVPEWGATFPRIDLGKVLRKACAFFVEDCTRSQNEYGRRAYNKIKHGLLLVPDAHYYLSQLPSAPGVIFDTIAKDHPDKAYTLHAIPMTDDDIERRLKAIFFAESNLRLFSGLYACVRYPNVLKLLGYHTPIALFLRDSFQEVLRFLEEVTRA